ncbi:UPF0182 family protein [Pyramidobacter piscolens]|uniref:UPF0182 family membrane protein n=1 Tax=Pyramidobacter piscolens TaxID=638849 RepID=UPI003AB6662C
MNWNNQDGNGPFGGFPFGGFPFGNGGSERREQRPSFPKVSLPFSRRTLFLLALLLAVAVGLPMIASFLADYYWYEAERITSVFWTRLLPQWALLGVFSAVAFVIVYPNLRAALRIARGIPGANDVLSLILNHKWSRWLPLAVGLFMAVSAGSDSMGQWQMILQFAHGGAFGVKDAIFGNDVGFYVFSLPFWNFLQNWLMDLLFNVLVVCGALYAFRLFSGARLGSVEIPRPVRAHALTLGAVLTALWGLSYVLQRYLLLYNPNGVVFGPGYTDIHATLLALSALAALAFAAAGLLLFAIRSNRSWKFIGIVVGVFVVCNVALRGLYPELVQRYIVVPNEFEKEKEYISNNIEATLHAYGMDTIETSEITPDAGLTVEDAAADPETLENMRLWDYRALLRSYKQLQEIRSYYDFSAIDIDRYTIGGKMRQVMLAPRELDLSGMQNRTWVNQHLEFTHGYGIVMNGAREVGQNGQPNLWIKDLPSVSAVDLPISRPQIYFGENPMSYAFVKTSVKEFDYPMGESNARSTYEGDGGVPIGSLWRRLVYTLAFGDSKILFSDVFTPESRVIYERNVRARLSRAAPFLAYDSDPYIAVIGGRIVWIVDAYTTSSLYPYSEPVGQRYRRGRLTGGINYIRNSVKCTVDAYDGHMKFYVIDEHDPIIACWRRIFPALFSPGGEMSAELRAHLRYPRDLFSVQANIYRTYHMADPNTFYNKEDVWNTLQGEENEGTLSSYYVMNKLIGESKPEFLMMTPYTPVGRDNMIAWMAGRCDGANYGKLVLYRFPKQTLIYGPNQISALINQTPEISAQLSLWSQRGSDVILGHLLVVPVNNSLLYVRPLYLKASQSDLPELKRVILSSGGHVVWDETFEGALEKLLNYRPGEQDASLSLPSGQTPQSGFQPALPAAGDSEIQALGRQAKNAWDRSQQALKSADWNAYGQAMGDLEKSLNAMFPQGIQ